MRSEESRVTLPGEKLRRRLIRMLKLDQGVRCRMFASAVREGPSLMRVDRADRILTRLLTAIIRENGWPTISAVGREAARSAATVLLHSPDASLPERVLPTLEKLAARGEVEPWCVAYVTDRVLVDRGLPQRFGTQVETRGSRIVLVQTEDVDRLDLIRQSTGLPPLALYLNLLSRQFATRVGVAWE